jgi:hypothetical protein
MTGTEVLTLPPIDLSDPSTWPELRVPG